MTVRDRLAAGFDPVAGSRLLTARVRTVCAWCDRLLVAGPPAPVSHGCCDDCLERLLAA